MTTESAFGDTYANVVFGVAAGGVVIVSFGGIVNIGAVGVAGGTVAIAKAT